MKPKLLCLIAFLAMLLPVSMAQADDVYGVYTARGYGLDETQAYLNCMDQVNDFAKLINDNLEPGFAVVGVVFIEGNWDDPEYSIKFVVFVSSRGGI